MKLISKQNDESTFLAQYR